MKKTKVVRPSSKKFSLSTSAKSTLEYEKDFSKWASDQANFLRNGEYTKLDRDNLIGEIEDLSKREKQRLTNYLENLLMHKLKVKYQPSQHTTSWDLSIKEASYKVQKTLSENPSLQPKLKEILEDAYFSARIRAALETQLDETTFPEKCPWVLKDIFPKLVKKYC